MSVLTCGHKDRKGVDCACAVCPYCSFVVRAQEWRLPWRDAAVADSEQAHEQVKQHSRTTHPLEERVNTKIWRWLYGANGGVLHRLATMSWNSDDMEGLGEDWMRNCLGTTLCGRNGRWFIPGILSRLGAPRCKACCKKAGVPSGNGTPWNDHSLPAEVQAR